MAADTGPHESFTIMPDSATLPGADNTLRLRPFGTCPPVAPAMPGGIARRTSAARAWRRERPRLAKAGKYAYQANSDVNGRGSEMADRASLFSTTLDLGQRALDRVGLFGLVVSSAAMVALDFVARLDSTYSLLLTVFETGLLVPWAFAVLRLDRNDPLGQRWSDRSVRLIHAANLLLLSACLWQKWQLVLSAPAGGESALSRYRLFTMAAYVLVNLGLLGHGRRLGRFLLVMSQRPARLTALSFGLTGLMGALVLSFPQALRSLDEASFVDALFTSVSAVCVTGLVVHGTAETYTPFGQGVILALIQVGGIGIMAIYATFAVLAGRRLRMRSAAVLADLLDANSVSELRRTLWSIVVYTLAFELLGAIVLFCLFVGRPEIALGPEAEAPLAGAGGALWAAIFHAVSAFCNAGFTVFHAGALPFADDAGVSLTLILLITIGGLGFPVLRELGEQVTQRRRGLRPRRLSLHTRTVLVVSGLLVVVGTLLFLIGEWRGVLAGRPLGERVLASLFQSVTARTAGFNTVAIDALSAGTAMGMCLLMLVGASPGSTGGGVKTTTVAVLFSTFRGELMGGKSTTLLDRSLGRATVRRAVGVFCVSGALLAGLMLLLLLVESQAPLSLVFEAVSAFGTVGLSTGITPELSTGGKLVIVATMFAGRIGPMTLALALSGGNGTRRARPAEEAVRIG